MLLVNDLTLQYQGTTSLIYSDKYSDDDDISKPLTNTESIFGMISFNMNEFIGGTLGLRDSWGPNW